MKQKTFSLMALTILSLVMLVGFASAAFVLSPSSISKDISSGTTSTSFTIYVDNDGVGGDYSLTWNGTTSQGVLVSPTLVTSLDGQNQSTSFSITSIPTSFVGTITGTLIAESTLVDRTMSFTINVLASTTDVPEDIIECALTGTTGNLKIEIDDINNVAGFGDDNEWLPLDKIEVDIKVENDGDEKIKNIEVKWGLYDVDNDNWVFDEKESDFNLKDGDDKTITVTFDLSDPSDYEDGNNFVFYVWAT
ncbi:MAG: hypothetical protein V1788_01520, partial [Nanoarchaeota archaeon]